MPPRKSTLSPVAVTITSASSSLAGLELDPPLGEGLDPVGDDLGLAPAQRLEEVAVGDQAHALVPGVVAGLEVGVDVVAGRQRAFVAAADQLLDAAPGGCG